VPYFAVKRKNPINEPLFAGPAPAEALNPYARIIIDEARRRGVSVEIIDADGGFFRLAYGGRSIRCRESLTDLTSSVAMSICDDKAVTRRLVEQAGISVPAQLETEDAGEIERFLAEHGALVVKPARGEQGRGVAVGVETPEAVAAAVENARRVCDRVLVEAFSRGEDLRLIVIGFELVAAAIRRPAQVVGDGRSTVRQLIAQVSRRRAAATGGESQIPLDDETLRCIGAAGSSLDAVLPDGQVLSVRKTANLHTGGTIHDVTDDVHPDLAAAAVTAARVIDIPVVGIDLIVPSHTEPDYVFIEANERPGLANHEPQPTAERFIDLLFPLSMRNPAQRARHPCRRPVVPRLRIDTDYLGARLSELLAIPSPTGYTDKIVRACSAELQRLGLKFELTRRGAIRAIYPGKHRRAARAVVSHLDTIGAQVKYVKDNGRLEVIPIGHWSARFAEGARCTIFTDKGSYRGTILPLKASGHTYHHEVDSCRSAGTTSSCASMPWRARAGKWRSSASTSATSSPSIPSRSSSTTASSSPGTSTTRAGSR
jgi:D-alanine-D-alanine ligase-like ATP-grasp enzyme